MINIFNGHFTVKLLSKKLFLKNLIASQCIIRIYIFTRPIFLTFSHLEGKKYPSIYEQAL